MCARTMIYDIPDPFQVFVKHKYVNFKGMKYDFFAREWGGNCFTCNEEIYAPTKKDYIRTRLYHTRNICTGGY
jgi:hypothetical protein